MKSGIVLARRESPRTQRSFVSTRSACHPISVSARRIVQCSKGFGALRKVSARLPQLRHTRGSARPVISHKEEERKRHFQAGAEARRPPDRTQTFFPYARNRSALHPLSEKYRAPCTGRGLFAEIPRDVQPSRPPLAVAAQQSLRQSCPRVPPARSPTASRIRCDTI